MILSRSSRRGLVTVLVVVTTGDFGAALVAQVRPDASTTRRRVIREEITPELRLVVSRGFAYLIRRQGETDSFGSSQYSVAENALMGLAFLAGGYDDHSGPRDYVEALKRNTNRLLSHQKKNGYFDDDNSRMYGHGFATLFLAELYGMSEGQHERLRSALELAVKLIEHSQGQEGGWDYVPGGLTGRLERLGGGDTSITVCQTLALRAARNLGIEIDARVIDRAKRYIWNAQKEDGGFAYRVGGSLKIKDFSEFPRSAAGVCVLYSLGEYDTTRMRRGVDYLSDHYRKLNDFPHYAHYYCAQAMFQVGGRRWEEYFRWVSREIIDSQRDDGSWKQGTYETSSPVRTAMALIVLQLPYRFLPIHER